MMIFLVQRQNSSLEQAEIIRNSALQVVHELLD